MVHQHFKLIECFSVLDNIILGVETTKNGFLQKEGARKKVMALSEKYGLSVDPDAIIEDTTVGMQQRTEILKMLYRDNEILIFDEPTAVLTPQEIQELMPVSYTHLTIGINVSPSPCSADLYTYRKYNTQSMAAIIERYLKAIASTSFVCCGSPEMKSERIFFPNKNMAIEMILSLIHI